MNCLNILTGLLRPSVKPVFATSNGLLAQHTRNTFILRRKFLLPLNKKSGKQRILRQKQFIYELVENTETRPHKPIDIILTQYVPGIGGRGEILSVKPMTAYNTYLLPGLAVYASPENLAKYKEIVEKAKNDEPEFSSRWAYRTMKELSTTVLGVRVNQNNPWTLQKFHVRTAFRHADIHVTDEAITLPEHEIRGPDLQNENKEFYVTVTMNKKEKVKVRCRLIHYTNKESEKLPTAEYWRRPAEALFPEDQPILDSLPRPAEWDEEDEASAV